MKFNIDSRCVDNDLLLSYFAAWKFHFTTNKSKYISKIISGIISTFNSQSLQHQINRKNFNYLRKVIYGISTFPGRESHEAFPIRDNVLIKIIMSFKLNYQGILKKTMIAFAKGFALRIVEYTSPSWLSY